jgi:integrase
MAGRAMYLTNRNGRFFARLVIPKDLRPFMGGKTELRTALGADRRTALRSLHGAVAELRLQITAAERRAVSAGAAAAAPGRYPLSNGQIALQTYEARLAQDQDGRNKTRFWGAVAVDDVFVADLRDGMAGKLSDKQLAGLVGHWIEHFVSAGNTTVVFGTEEWRNLTRDLCRAEYEALERVSERDEGVFDGKLSDPLLVDAVPVADELPPVPIWDLFEAYVASRKLVGSQRDNGNRQRPVIKSLIKFIGHKDARCLSKRDIIAWRDFLLTTKKPKTVSDIYLSAIRSMLNWAVQDEKLPTNAAADVKQSKPKTTHARELGYTDAEALAVLIASRSYAPAAGSNGKVRERAATIAAKRWIPILCAFTGARVSEMTQLRKEDVRQEGAIHVMRITPDAGTVKSGGYRDVPMHDQLVGLGFLDFVMASSGGSLFSRSLSSDIRSQRSSAKRVGGQVCDWLQSLNLVPDELWPNHAFRHRFKTVGRDCEIQDTVLDAICGHSGKTAGDRYGSVTLAARQKAISKFPWYNLAGADSKT